MPEAAQPRVQANEVTYELHSLGWKAFQQLCVTVISEVWGQHVQSFFDSRDGGRDGAFHGAWSPKSGELLHGSFTVQCKFTSLPGKTLKFSDLSDELAKAKRLAARGLADNYFLFTNARLTGSTDEKIRAAFTAIPGIAHFSTYGADRIAMFIRESPRLRMLVPRVYGLGDLSQILDERAYAQAVEVLSALGDDLGKFVITDAYQKSAKALVEHGFVLLLGEPACGKSTIAAALAVGALDEWGCSTIKVRDADDFVRHSNPNEPKQFFWVDDAFGATQIDWQSAFGWNRAFPHVQAAIRRGAKVVFTSRDYIYRSAKSALKQSALPIIQESQVVIRVEQLSKDEKEQILYNHIRLGTQSTEFKRSVKPFLPVVSAHQRFSPEIARRLGNPAFTRNLYVSEWGLVQFVERPMELLKEIIQTLDAHSRSAVALVFMRGGVLPSPVTFSLEEEEAIKLLGGAAAEVRNALAALDGSLLLQVQQGGDFSWRLKHPTIRDAFAALIAENRELMDIYLAGTPVRQLFQEASCGDVGLEGVKVIVPTDRYDALWLRIERFLAETRESKDPVNRFLASRCDRNFLSGFIARNPGFVSALRTGSYLSAVSDAHVIVQLRQLDLLPETERLRHVAAIKAFAVETPDADFLRDVFRPLFTTTELDDILGEVRSQLLPDISKCIADWQSNHDGETDPDSYFDLLKSTLTDYREAFSADIESVAFVNAGLEEIQEVIEALRSKLPQPPEDEDFLRDSPRGNSSDDSRSIFDDVDC
jgi:energy-coupling factor transporter ATP-binding protein EcfA2